MALCSLFIKHGVVVYCQVWHFRDLPQGGDPCTMYFAGNGRK